MDEKGVFTMNFLPPPAANQDLCRGLWGKCFFLATRVEFAGDVAFLTTQFGTPRREICARRHRGGEGFGVVLGEGKGKKKLGKQHKWCGYLLVSKEFSIVLFL